MSSHNFKVVLLGQGCVGKTSLVLRYVSNVFNDSHQSTMQASYSKKQLYLDQDLIRLNIWDTVSYLRELAGQEKFHALGPIYYREANGALLIYDVTSPDSLRKVRDWVKELNKMLGSDNVKLAIVGNKMDLLNASEQKCPQNNPIIQDALQLTNELMNAKHYLTSARLNQGIGEMFISLSRRMMDQSRRQKADKLNPAQRFSRIMPRSLAVASEDGSQSSDEPQSPSGGGLHRGSSNRRLDLAGDSVGKQSCQCWK